MPLLRVTSLAFFLLIGTVLALYWPGLHGPLMLDDHPNLESLKRLEEPTVAWADVIFDNESGQLGRPISMATFVANYLTSGWDVWTFKYGNLMLHLLSGCLIFWLAGRLLEKVISPRQVWPIALWVTALWLLSPLLVSTVLYSVQRMAQLSTLFTLAGCLSYVVGRQQLDQRRWSGISLTLASLFLWLPLAALSKENGILLPALLLVIELFFFRFVGSIFTRRYLIIFFALSVILPAIVALTILIIQPDRFFTYAHREFTLTERLLTESRVLFVYLGNLLLPVKSGTFGLFHDDFLLSKGWTDPPTTLIAILGWTILFILPFIFRFYRIYLLFFGSTFFLVGHSLESSIFPLEIYFEHRNYLPAVGIFLSLGIGLAFFTEKIKHPRAILLLALSLPLVYSLSTYQRVITWSSQELILLSAEHYHPNSSRLNIELASFYANSGQHEQALEHLETGMRLNPSLHWGPTLHRIAIFCTTGLEIPQQIYLSSDSALVKRASHHDLVYSSSALDLINKFLSDDRCPNLNINKFAEMIYNWATKIPEYSRGLAHWSILMGAARTEELAGNSTAALALLQQAITLYPHRMDANLLAIKLQLQTGDLAGAQRSLYEAQGNNLENQQYVTSWLKGYSQLLEIMAQENMRK